MADLQNLPAFGPGDTVNIVVKAPRGANPLQVKASIRGAIHVAGGD